MARAPDKDKIKAEYLKGVKPKELSDEYEISINTIKSWIKRYGWSKNKSQEGAPKKKKGAPLNNSNAVGHGAPKGNKNAETNGFFSKYLPEDTFNIIKEIEQKDPLDILWENIQIQYAAIIRAQRIMEVSDKSEMIKELKKQTRGDTSDTDEYEFQFAWDRQATFLQAQSRAMKTLESMIKNYDEMLHKNWNLATEEQKVRISKLKAEVEGLTKEDEISVDEKEFKLPANIIAPAFTKVLFDIEEENHSEYLLSGGRGSTKSSFISLELINLIKKNPDMHACILRQVANTLRDSVFNQIKWAISALDLEGQFKTTLSPLEITYIPTGQKIYFRGADDPDKIKSIKVPFGYIGIAWLEELDQFAGPEAVRKIEQSIIRGGDKAFIFKSFNPPKTANNWANKYAKVPKVTRYDHTSTYLDVPSKWLGKPFIDEAKFLESVNPDAYEHEYLGVANGNGGNIFDNVQIRSITDDEISIFDRLYNGVDWGWYPDPWAFNKMHYDAARRTLFIFDEAHENKKSNEDTAKILKEEHGIKPNDKVVCDSSEQKSVEDYKSNGIFARGAIKGPGSVDYSMKWLQSLNAIIIDNSRCPHTATEFLNYEYERDKEGNVISGYPDENNHHIDAIRYAMEEVWRRRGQ